MNLWLGNGRVATEMNVKYTGTGTANCRFQLAVSKKDSPKGKDEKQAADFIEIVVWGTLAETCGNSLKKGDYLQVVGKINTWMMTPTGGEGKRKITEVVAISLGTSLTANGIGAVAKSAIAGLGEVLPDEDIPF